MIFTTPSLPPLQTTVFKNAFPYINFFQLIPIHYSHGSLFDLVFTNSMSLFVLITIITNEFAVPLDVYNLLPISIDHINFCSVSYHDFSGLDYKRINDFFNLVNYDKYNKV